MANALSLLRILLVAPLLVSLHRDGERASAATVLVLLAAALSDLADGYVARRYGQVSRTGRILDPVADKLFVGSLGIGLYCWRGFPAWLLAGILLRDVGIVAVGCYLLRAHGLVLSPSRSGKFATVSLIVAGLAYLLPVPGWLRGALSWLAAGMLVVSSLDYLRLLRRHLGALRHPAASTRAAPSRAAPSRCGTLGG